MEAYDMKWKRLMLWILLNGGIAYLAYLTFVESAVWAGNILKFFLWFFLIIYLIANMSSEVKASSRKKGKSVPDWVSATYDFGLMAVLAANGWFFYAAMTALLMVLYFGIYGNSETVEE